MGVHPTVIIRGATKLSIKTPNIMTLTLIIKIGHSTLMTYIEYNANQHSNTTSHSIRIKNAPLSLTKLRMVTHTKIIKIGHST